ncbi:8157_t:CDS:2, partial [Racocetra persica]
GKIGTISKQKNSPLKRSPKIKKVNCKLYNEDDDKIDENNEIDKDNNKTNKDDKDNNNEINEDNNKDNYEDDEIDIKDIDKDDYENNNRDEKTRERKKLEKKLFEGFKLRFEVINMDDKLMLLLGRFVEDVLYNWAVTQYFK